MFWSDVLFGGAFFGRIQRAGDILCLSVAAFLNFLRSFDERTKDRSINFSGTYGADTYVGGERLDKPAPETPVLSADRSNWSSALDFSGPPPLSHGQFPRVLDPRATSIEGAVGRLHSANIPHDRQSPRVVTLLAAVIMLITWIGTGRGNPSLPPRNPAADSVAEKFSGSSSGFVDSTASSQNGDLGNDRNAYDFGGGSGIIAARFEFAPRLSEFFEAGDDVRTGGMVTLEPAAEHGDPPFETGSNPQGPANEKPAGDVGVVMIRHLPVGSSLSSGTRVSPTDWALARSDLKSVTVTLPAGRRGNLKADIE
ncbi:MAG: hypothetical protein ABL893_18490, partial [Hyphomicrobium sp.]